MLCMGRVLQCTFNEICISEQSPWKHVISNIDIVLMMLQNISIVYSSNHMTFEHM